MPIIECLAAITRRAQGDLGDDKTGSIHIARSVVNLAHTALGVGPAGQSVIGAAQQRDAVFDRAKYAAGGLLPLLGTWPNQPSSVRLTRKSVSGPTCSRASCANISSKHIRTDILAEGFLISNSTGRSPGVISPPMGVSHFKNGSQRTSGMYSPKMTSRRL